MLEFFRRNRLRHLLVLSCLAVIAVLCGWWLQGHPQDVGEAASDKLQCLSYAPFRKAGETPLREEAMVSEARLREDLGILAARTDCVRTYSVIQGLDAVPRVARSLGMQVLLGAWIGRERDKNEIELAEAIRLANEYPETVRGIVVGNEVLLRRELPASVLAGYLDRVRAAVEVPVTYADVWEFWSQHRELAQHVSFVTVHILPYWEDHPVGIDAAIEHIVGTAEAMRKLFDGKDVLIGETGWPSAGRQRDAAVASRVNQARFLRQFSQAAAGHQLAYNFIEGFDQPWKRGQEGAMGGNWGVFDSAGEPKFAATGPVAEDPDWYQGWLAALVAALLFGLLARFWLASRLQLAFAIATGAVTGGLAMAAWRYLVVWNRNLLEWGVTGLFCLSGILMVLVVLRLCIVQVAPTREQPARRVPSMASLWRMREDRSGILNLLGMLRSFFLFAGATMVLLLVFDARYRGFPSVLYLLPVFALLLAQVAGFRMAGDVEERLLAAVCLLGAIAFVLLEGFNNQEALRFAATLVLMAGLASDGRFWLPRPADDGLPARAAQPAGEPEKIR